MGLLRYIRQLASGWWRGDRIRVSPFAGLLLRLQPGSILTLAGRPFAGVNIEILSREILSRDVLSTSHGPSVCYRFCDGAQQGMLLVGPATSEPGCPPQVWLVQEGEMVELEHERLLPCR